MKRERKLTEREIKRVEALNVITGEYSNEGYKRDDVTVSIVFANIISFIWGIPFVVAFVCWFIIRNGNWEHLSVPELFVFAIVLVALVVVHELLHGLVWGLFAPGGFRKIEFGFIKEMLTPYCTCGEPLKKGEYILGTLMPGLVLGILPAIAGVLCGSLFWLMIGVLMTVSAGGDFIVIVKMLFYKAKSNDMVIMDHPSECGFVVFKR